MLVTCALPRDTALIGLHRHAPERYPLLLESVAHGTAQGRWDLLIAADGGSLTLHADGITRDADGTRAAGDFLSVLDADWRALRQPREEPRWPFRGGWALFLAYELAAEIEPVLRLPAAEGRLPVALALRCPAAVLRDRATGDCIAVAETARADMLGLIVDDLASAGLQATSAAWTAPSEVDEDTPEDFTAGVRRILDYLAAGDVFQANLSRGWRARSTHACATPIRRRSPACSRGRAGRWPARRRSAWSRCVATWWRRAPSPAPARAWPATMTLPASAS
jgi:anthranilate synthase component I